MNETSNSAQVYPLISPGWSHYILNAPLSPRAQVSVTKQLRDFAAKDTGLSTLGGNSLNIGLMDLGILPTSIEPLLCQTLHSGLKSYASIRLQSTQFRVSSTQSPLTHSPSHHLWLEFKDRLGVLSMVYKKLEHLLSHLAPELSLPIPSCWAMDQKFLKEKSLLLCGVISSYNSNRYDQSFSVSSWVNEISLQKRPSHFSPLTGYQSVWSYTLPVETPELEDHDDSDLYLNHESKLQNFELNKRLRLDYPLAESDLKILQQLEFRLKQVQAQHTSSLNPNQPSLTPSTVRKKRRKKR